MPKSMTTGSTTSSSTTSTSAEPAYRVEALILLLASCLSVLGAVLLAPVLPRMQDAFAGTPGVDVLVPITLTVPALMIGLLAFGAGRIVDAIGRKRLLVVSLVVYAVFGTAPLWLQSLPLIVLSRAGVGIAEAAIMTCCTTLLMDYFSGSRRDRILARQTIFTTIGATLFFAIGGALGDISWRAPFWLYASSLVLAVLVVLFVHPPTSSTATTARRLLPALPWRTLGPRCAVAFFGGIAFYAMIVELSYVLDGLGVESTATIGAASAIASLATAAGAFAFGRAAGFGPAVLLPTAFGLAGLGLLVVSVAGSVPLVVIGAVVTSAGTGLLLPTMLTWALSGLTFAQRGRGAGLFTAALFLGQFVCPLVLLGIGAGLGGLNSALALLGAACLLMTVGVRVALRSDRSSVPA